MEQLSSQSLIQQRPGGGPGQREPLKQRRCLSWWPGRLVTGGMGLGAVVWLTLPVIHLPLAQVEELNRELGRLCSNPPRQALTVCRIHARLVKTL